MELHGHIQDLNRAHEIRPVVVRADEMGQSCIGPFFKARVSDLNLEADWL